MSSVPARVMGWFRDDADRAAAERAVAGHEIRCVTGPQLEERVVVEHVFHHGAHVVRRARSPGHRGGGYFAQPVAGVVGLQPGWIIEMVVGQVPEQRRERVAGGEMVGDDQRRDPRSLRVDRGTAELGARHAHAGEVLDRIGSGHVGEGVLGHDDVVEQPERERRTPTRTRR